MRLTCQKALFLVALLAFGCTDSSGPGTVAMQFTLNNINGRSLPTFLAPLPSGMTPTIVSNTLTLFKDGTSETTEHRVEWDGTDHTVTYQQQYRINGALELELLCPADAICSSTPHGRITGDHLALDVDGALGPIIYNYIATSE